MQELIRTLSVAKRATGPRTKRSGSFLEGAEAMREDKDQCLGCTTRDGCQVRLGLHRLEIVSSCEYRGRMS